MCSYPSTVRSCRSCTMASTSSRPCRDTDRTSAADRDCRCPCRRRSTGRCTCSWSSCSCSGRRRSLLATGGMRLRRRTCRRACRSLYRRDHRSGDRAPACCRRGRACMYRRCSADCTRGRRRRCNPGRSTLHRRRSHWRNRPRPCTARRSAAARPSPCPAARWMCRGIVWRARRLRSCPSAHRSDRSHPRRHRIAMRSPSIGRTCHGRRHERSASHRRRSRRPIHNRRSQE